MVQRASIPRGMFLVEDDEIETLEAKYLTILGRRHLHESAEHWFARDKAALEVIGTFSAAHHVAFSHSFDPIRAIPALTAFCIKTTMGY